MNIEQQHISIRGTSVEVVRKDIKNLHIAVYPPDGRVRAAVPLRLDDEGVRLALVTRLPWIKKQQKSFREQERQSEREMVSGECHYFQGRKYRLEVVKANGPQGVRIINNDRLQLRVHPGIGRDKKLVLLQQWYRQHLTESLPELQDKWEKTLGLKVDKAGIRIMKRRWGSCNIKTRRIWLNLELAKKPTSCLEYILVHEIIHFFERCHTERFRELMERYMPDWRLRRDELNRFPLAHEEWGY